jgi:hypothetical protein
VSKPSTPTLSAAKFLVPAAFIVAVAILSIIGITAGSSLHPRAARKSAVPSSSAQKQNVRASMGSLPLAFEANQGQTDPQVKYLARANGYTLFLTADDAVFSLHSGSAANSPAIRASARNAKPAKVSSRPDSVMHLHLLRGNALAKIEAQNPLPGKSNYFIGNDPSQWHANVAQYARVAYEDVYPGVNLAFYGAQRQMEFDFIVAPGADATRIQLSTSGAKRISTDNAGNLVLSANAGSVTLHKPVAYQEKSGQREPVEARFVVAAKNHIGFELGNYDRSRELIIDPSVAFATYLGGSQEDDGYAIAIDSSENAYITGRTASTDFPTVDPAYNNNAGGFDAFVTKISASGSLVYSTYVGGSGDDSGNAIAVDSNGNAFVAGGTASSNFPTTTGAFHTSLGTGATLNAFIFELNPAGSSLAYSTYLGGSSSDIASGIAVDSSDDAYVVGTTTSTNFPTTTGAFQTTIKQGGNSGTSNGFVSKLNPAGTALVYSTYLGGGPNDAANAIAVDNSGNAYVTGSTPNSTFPVTTGVLQATCGSCGSDLQDAFVSVINPAGSALVYSTFLGGSAADLGLGIAVDSQGDAYVTGVTGSSDFPTKSAMQPAFGGGTQDAFVTALNPTGAGLLYSTFLGGTGDDAGLGISVDSGGDVFVTGQTASTDFPTVHPTQAANGGGDDAFLTEIVPNSSSFYFSTYLGGSQNEDTTLGGSNFSLAGVAVDPAGASIYLTGNTASSTNFPTVSAEQGTYGGGATDAFVAKYTQPSYGITATTPAAVNAGSSATSTVTLTSYNGYSATPVNLTCTVTGSGSPLPQCSASSFSPNPVTPTTSGATTTLTITTTGSGGNAIRRARRTHALLLFPIVGLGLAGFFLILPVRRRKVLGLMMLAVGLTAVFSLPSCGGSSNSGGGGGTCSAVPNAPTGLAASGTTSTGTTLNWTAPTSLGANCTLGSYTIYEGGASIGTASTNSFNVTGLTASTTYSFTVAASDQAGMSPQSSAVSVTTSASGTPSGNYTVTITGTDTNNMTRSAQFVLTVN